MVTPTVELNALAMKRGERTEYVLESAGAAHQAQVPSVLLIEKPVPMFYFSYSNRTIRVIISTGPDSPAIILTRAGVIQGETTITIIAAITAANTDTNIPLANLLQSVCGSVTGSILELVILCRLPAMMPPQRHSMTSSYARITIHSNAQ